MRLVHFMDYIMWYRNTERVNSSDVHVYSVQPCNILLALTFHTDMSALQEFQKSVSTIQRDAVWWLHIVVPKMFNPSGKDFLSW